MGPRALQEEKQEAARRKLYNKDAEGARRTSELHNVTGRVAGGKALTRAADGQAGDPPDRELGHLEVRESAVAQKQGKGRKLGLVHSFSA